MLHMDRSPFFRKIVTEQIPYRGTFEKDEVTEQLAALLSGVWPKEVAIFPVIAEGRVVAFLFCDNYPGGDAISETEGLEIFINHAGLALEKSLLQRRIQEMEQKRDAG